MTSNVSPCFGVFTRLQRYVPAGMQDKFFSLNFHSSSSVRQISWFPKTRTPVTPSSVNNTLFRISSISITSDETVYIRERSRPSTHRTNELVLLFFYKDIAINAMSIYFAVFVNHILPS